jgi:hypothetical protein
MPCMKAMQTSAESRIIPSKNQLRPTNREQDFVTTYSTAEILA